MTKQRIDRKPVYYNDWCRMCAYFCSEWCYNYNNPENCKDWRLCKFPVILLTDSPETKEHVNKLHRRILLKKGAV